MVRRNQQLPKDITTKRPIYQIRFVKNPARSLRRSKNYFRLYPGPERSYYITERTLSILTSESAPFEIVRSVAPSELTVAVTIPIEALFYEEPADEIVAEVLADALARQHLKKPAWPLYIGRTAEDIHDSFVLDYPGGARCYRWRWIKKSQRAKLPTLAETFPKLIKLITDRNTKFVLSLGSGGLRMFAHASLLKFVEALGVKDQIEEIWGCSGGAIIGMGYSLGANPARLEQEGYDLYQKKIDFKVNPNKAEVIKNLFIDTFLPGTSLSASGFVDIRNAMKSSLERIAVHKRPFAPFFAIAYNMNTKKNDVLTPNRINSDLYDHEIKHCSIINSVLASSAIPVLHVPRIVKRGGAAFTYIDGSIFEEVPLSSIYNKWNIDRKNGVTKKKKKKKLFILAVDLFYFISTFSAFRVFPFNKLQLLRLFFEITKLTDRARAARIKNTMHMINDDPHAYAAAVTLPTLSRYNCLDPRIIPVAIDRAHASFFNQLVQIEKNLP